MRLTDYFNQLFEELFIVEKLIRIKIKIYLQFNTIYLPLLKDKQKRKAIAQQIKYYFDQQGVKLQLTASSQRVFTRSDFKRNKIILSEKRKMVEYRDRHKKINFNGALTKQFVALFEGTRYA